MRSVSGITTNQDDQNYLSQPNWEKSFLPQNSIFESSESSKNTFPNHSQNSSSTESPGEELQSNSNWLVPPRNNSGKCRQRGVTANLECQQSSSKAALMAKVALIVLGVSAALYLVYRLGYANGAAQNQCFNESIQQIRQCREEKSLLIAQCGEEKTQLINQCYEKKKQLIAECAADRKEWYAKGKEACEANARLERAIQRM